MNLATTLAERGFRRAGVLQPGESFADHVIGSVLSLRLGGQADVAGTTRIPRALLPGPAGVLAFTESRLLLLSRQMYQFELTLLLMIRRSVPDKTIEIMALHPARSGDELPATFIKYQSAQPVEDETFVAGVLRQRDERRQEVGLAADLVEKFQRWEAEVLPLPFD